MNDNSLDPQLQSFEARLAGQSPRVPPAERDRLLYACAFTAGRSTAAGSIRLLRIATVVLGIACVAAWAPIGREPAPIANRHTEAPALADKAVLRNPVLTSVDGAAHAAMVANLDAWQSPPDSHDLLSEQFSQFRALDSRTQSLAVGVLTHKSFNH